MGMGFADKQARDALAMTKNDLDMAIEMRWLPGHEHVCMCVCVCVCVWLCAEARDTLAMTNNDLDMAVDELTAGLWSRVYVDVCMRV